MVSRIAVCDFLRFGTNKNADNLLKETVRGISDYGNCFGVANVGGNCIRDKMYDNKISAMLLVLEF